MDYVKRIIPGIGNKGHGQPMYLDSSSIQELMRIQQTIRQASLRHHELSGWRQDEGAEDLTKRLVGLCDRKQDENMSLRKQIQKWRQDIFQLQERIAAKDRRFNEETITHRDQLKEAKEHFENLLKIEQQKHNEAMKRLKFQQEIELQESRQAAEDLKQQLAAREHIKGLSDRELIKQFKQLSSDIEEFSRLEWDAQREPGWPISEHAFEHLYPRNVRKLKQNVVQNCLWIILYETIFRTPFRIIGEYGQVFDNIMYEANSDIFESLSEEEKIDFNTKRYKNAKVFLDALDSSSQPPGNAPAIRQSFQRARKAVLVQILNALSRLTLLDQRSTDVLDRIVQVAARLWLDICTNRFRVFVIIPDGSEDILRLPRDKIRSLKLVIKPELHRYGNSQGEEICEGTPLAGWTSELETLPSIH